MMKITCVILVTFFLHQLCLAHADLLDLLSPNLVPQSSCLGCEEKQQQPNKETVRHVEPRQISWWWSSPATEDDPGVKGLLNFVSNNTDIVTTIIARCGIVTCVRNTSTHRPHSTCLNNNGTGGKITGELTKACMYVLPELKKLGVRVELWLGEDDSYESAQYLFKHPEETAQDLLKVADKYKGWIQGFNLDLEPGVGGNSTDVMHFSSFLGQVTKVLNAEGLRFSADVGCLSVDSPENSFATDCTTLSHSGVNRLMNMRTYNAQSFEEWVYTRLFPALSGGVQHNVIGMGLGCWADGNIWSTTAVSAEDRICYLMNQSSLFSQELDMFTIAMDDKHQWPLDFWLSPLRKWMGGGTCNAKIPVRTTCPNATVGDREHSWFPGGPPHCCVSFGNRGQGLHCNETCAEQECLSDKGMVWLPENYSTHPYTCCRKA